MPNTQASVANVSVYPNPAADELTIKMGIGAYSSYTVTNSVGQEIMKQVLNGAAQTKVNISKLPPGLHYIPFRGGQGSKVQKFVKM